MGWAVENLMLKNYYKINGLPSAQSGQPAMDSSLNGLGLKRPGFKRAKFFMSKPFIFRAFSARPVLTALIDVLVGGMHVSCGRNKRNRKRNVLSSMEHPNTYEMQWCHNSTLGNHHQTLGIITEHLIFVLIT